MMKISQEMDDKVFERFYEGEINLDELLEILKSLREWSETGMNLIKRIGIENDK